MYKTEIGTNAGKVWRILKETREITLQDLAGKLELSVEDTALAVGWLAVKTTFSFKKRTLHSGCRMKKKTLCSNSDKYPPHL